MKSSNPRTALTGVPSGPRNESGTPKKARKYNEAVSKSIILRERTTEYWHDTGMEKLDRRILALLARDGRMSYTDIGKETGLSTSAAQQRVRRLEQRGVIKGYTAVLDSAELGLLVTAFVAIKPFDPSQPDDAPDRLQHIEEIISCYSVAGDPSYLLKVQVPTMSHLESLLARIRADGKVSTHTTTVLSIPYEDRPPL